MAPGSGGRTDGLRGPVGGAGVVGASEMAMGVVVGVAVPTGLSRAGLSARGVRTSRGAGQWTAGVVAPLLARLPA